jgi:hypothetical protein
MLVFCIGLPYLFNSVRLVCRCLVIWFYLINENIVCYAKKNWLSWSNWSKNISRHLRSHGPYAPNQIRCLVGWRRFTGAKMKSLDHPLIAAAHKAHLSLLLPPGSFGSGLNAVVDVSLRPRSGTPAPRSLSNTSAPRLLQVSRCPLSASASYSSSPLRPTCNLSFPSAVESSTFNIYFFWFLHLIVKESSN